MQQKIVGKMNSETLDSMNKLPDFQPLPPILSLKAGALLLLIGCFGSALAAEQVLVRIGEHGRVTAVQLDQAMQAAPFATQFPALDEQQQAYLRGDMRLRLVKSEALYQEALAQGLQHQARYQREMATFRTSLLAQRYLDSLHEELSIPPAIENDLRKKLAGNVDAIAAAESAFIARRYKALKQQRLDELRQRFQVIIHHDRLQPAMDPDTVLAEGNGIRITYRDLLDPGRQTAPPPDRLQKQLHACTDTTVLALAAEEKGIAVEKQLARYSRGLLSQLLLEEQEKRWIPDEQTLRDYFQAHPELGLVPERRQIGQLVVATREEAERLRQRILQGESLFTLAAEYSIDPYGRQHAGDMGWMREGSGFPAIEAALQDLPDNQVSEIVETDRGYHLVIIVQRKPAENKSYAAVRDRVERALLAEKMDAYLRQLMAKHPVQWQMQTRR